MKATDDKRVEFGKIVDTKVVHSIDYGDLEMFLGGLFCCQMEMLESPNDMTHTTSIDEGCVCNPDELEEIEIEFEKGHFEYWRLHQVFEWLYHYDYIPAGNYNIDVSW